MTRERLLAFIKQEIATETGKDIPAIGEDLKFHTLGLDSLSAVLILHNISQEFDIELSPIVFWDYPTPALLADHIAEQKQSA